MGTGSGSPGGEASGSGSQAGGSQPGSDLQCTICQEGDLQEVGELDCCDHCYCIRCILEWSRVTNTCPLCKQRFTSVSHKRLDLARLPPPDSDVVAERFPGSVLRVHSIEQRNQRPEPPEQWEDPLDTLACMECAGTQDEDLILLCDSCNQGCHTYCATPPLQGIPEGEWFCSVCSPALAPAAAGNAAATPASQRPRQRRRLTRAAAAAATGSEDSDFCPSSEGEAERELAISQAAAAIASGVGAPRRRRSRAATRQRRLSSAHASPYPSRAARTAGGAARTRRLVRHVSAVIDLSPDEPLRAPTAAHRNVEALRQNWADIRRGAARFAQSGSDDEVEAVPLSARLQRMRRSGGSEPTSPDDMPIATRIAFQRAREALEAKRQPKRPREASGGGGGRPPPQPTFSISSLFRRDLAQATERSRRIDAPPRSTARQAPPQLQQRRPAPSQPPQPSGAARPSSQAAQRPVVQPSAAAALAAPRSQPQPAQEQRAPDAAAPAAATQGNSAQQVGSSAVRPPPSGGAAQAAAAATAAARPASAAARPAASSAAAPAVARPTFAAFPAAPPAATALPTAAAAPAAAATPAAAALAGASSLPGPVSSRQQPASWQASSQPACSPGSSSGAPAAEGADREGLRARKHAAGSAIKEQLDPWWQQGRLSFEQYKQLAKDATHRLYRSEAAVGSAAWREQAQAAALKEMKRARVGKYAAERAVSEGSL